MQRLLFAVVLLLLCLEAARVRAETPAPVDAVVARAIAENAGSISEREELQEIYGNADGQFLWATPARSHAFIKLIASLDADGIDLRQLGPLPGPHPSSDAQHDVVATRTVLRAAHILASGAIDATAVPGWSLDRPSVRVAARISAAVRGDMLAALFDELRPSHDGYARLRRAYTHYRRLATETWPPFGTAGPRIVERDDERVPEITRRLALLGDLGTPMPAAEIPVSAVQAFQKRHGLEPDGRVGPATLAQLSVSPAARAEQIAINLEYWRLLPRTWPQRHIIVNSAAAELDIIVDAAPTYRTRVIVGDADHPTPVTTANISAVTFNPPWSVPHSIASKEILPKLQRDATYLARNNMEIVGRPYDPHGRDIEWRAYSQRRFPFQIRQSPGPRNALGIVKFEMANPFDIFLHDTPDNALFGRAARALSHGCVRVQCARELAERLIDDPTAWYTTDLAMALAEGRTRTVPLKHPVPVYLLYFTAFVDPDGTVHFRPDVYGRDQIMRRERTASLAAGG